MTTRDVTTVGRFERHQLPDGAVVFYRDSDHAYFGDVKESKRANGGFSGVQASRLAGGSTIGKVMDLDAGPLLWWAAKMDQVGIAALASSAMAADEPLDWLRSQPGIDAALREAGLTWQDVRNQAAERGTTIHEQVFLAMATKRKAPNLADLDEAQRGYGQAAMRWWAANRPQALYAEQVTADLDRGIAGRFDLLCMIRGKRVLVDAKTRERGGAYASDHTQLAGYEHCNVVSGFGASDRQIVLVLRPDGVFVEHEGCATQEDFLVALAAYQHTRALERRMRGSE